MTPDLDALAARALALGGGTGRVLLGLAGAPGAGKSTLAAALVDAVEARQPGRAVTVPMDGFHLAAAELERLGRADRKGASDTFDAAGYAAMLRRLRVERDTTVYAPVFRRDLEEPVAGAIPVLPGHRVVVTEGNYLLLDAGAWVAVHGLLDEVWFVDCDAGRRVDRLVARHVAHGRSPDAARAWVERSDEANARLVQRTAARADLVVRE